MKHYEIYRLDDPKWVSGAQYAESPEEALEKEAKLYPDCIVDTGILTLINQNGAHGVREAIA